MSNKEIFKEIFDEKFNSEKIKQEILSKEVFIERNKNIKEEILNEKNNNKNLNEEIINEKNNSEEIKQKTFNKKIKLLKWSLAPICLSLIIGSLIILNKENTSKPNIIYEKQENIELNINKIKEHSLARVDCDIKIMSKEELTNHMNDSASQTTKKTEILEKIKIPDDLDSIKNNLIYVRNNENNKTNNIEEVQDKEYNKLNNYNFIYYNTKNQRKINISFSNENKPIRDYFFTEENSKISKINNVELKIYNYESTYFAEFIYNNYYFDIETTDITQEELVELLKSIII